MLRRLCCYVLQQLLQLQEVLSFHALKICMPYDKHTILEGIL